VADADSGMDYVVIGIDIEGFSGSNGASEMISKRTLLTEMITIAQQKSGLSKYANGNEKIIDAGDGLFALLDTGDSLKILEFLKYLQSIANNRKELRFRVAAHRGPCEQTASIYQKQLSWLQASENVVGDGINATARFLDSAPLREALKTQHSEYCIFGLSDRLYGELSGDITHDSRAFRAHEVHVKQFKGQIHIFSPQSERPTPITLNAVPLKFKDSFLKFLNRSEFSPLHEAAAKKGENCFVFPTLTRNYETKLGNEKISALKYFKKFQDIPKNVVISGDELIGKSTLCREIARLLAESPNLLPILIHLTPEYSGLLEKKIERALNRQYANPRSEYENRQRVIILDDFHLLPIKYQQKIFKELKELKSAFTILTVDSIYNINFVEREFKQDYDSVSIREFGLSHQSQIITKWMNLYDKKNENFKQHDEIEEYLHSTLASGLVPATPFNILVILEERDAFKPLKGDVTSKGHCYEALIYIALKKINIPDYEADILLNLLEYLSYDLYKRQNTHITKAEYEEFLNKYAGSYNQPMAISEVIEKLESAKIFFENSLGEFHFGSKYIHYFFVARYLANHKNESEAMAEIDKIYETLEKSESGYIGVFIIHHTRDYDILDKILAKLSGFYEEFPEATLNKSEIEFLNKHTDKLGRIVLDAQNNSIAERAKRLEMAEHDEEVSKESVETGADTDFNVSSELKSLRKALKTTEVMGHILKARAGSLLKEKQKEYLRTALKVYFRITARFAADFRDNEADFVDFFERRVRKFSKDKLDNMELYELANNVYFNFNLMNYYACIKRASAELCSEQLINIASEVCAEIGTPLAQYIDLFNRMWYAKQLPVKELLEKIDKKSPVATRIIGEIVSEYCKLHNIDIQDKERLCRALEWDLKRLTIEKM